MGTTAFNMSGSLDNYRLGLQAKMARMFEREMNRIINEYQDKLREALVDVATGYTCEIVSTVEDYDDTRRVIVEVKWPNDETKDSTDEVGYTLQEGQSRLDQT